PQLGGGGVAVGRLLQPRQADERVGRRLVLQRRQHAPRAVEIADDDQELQELRLDAAAPIGGDARVAEDAPIGLDGVGAVAVARRRTNESSATRRCASMRSSPVAAATRACNRSRSAGQRPAAAYKSASASTASRSAGRWCSTRS